MKPCFSGYSTPKDPGSRKQGKTLPGTTIIDVYLCEEMNDFEPVHLLDLVGRFHYSHSLLICFYHSKQ